MEYDDEFSNWEIFGSLHKGIHITFCAECAARRNNAFLRFCLSNEDISPDNVLIPIPEEPECFESISLFGFLSPTVIHLLVLGIQNFLTDPQHYLLSIHDFIEEKEQIKSVFIHLLFPACFIHFIGGETVDMGAKALEELVKQRPTHLTSKFLVSYFENSSEFSHCLTQNFDFVNTSHSSLLFVLVNSLRVAARNFTKSQSALLRSIHEADGNFFAYFMYSSYLPSVFASYFDIVSVSASDRILTEILSILTEASGFIESTISRLLTSAILETEPCREIVTFYSDIQLSSLNLILSPIEAGYFLLWANACELLPESLKSFVPNDICGSNNSFNPGFISISRSKFGETQAYTLFGLFDPSIEQSLAAKEVKNALEADIETQKAIMMHLSLKQYKKAVDKRCISKIYTQELFTKESVDESPFYREFSSNVADFVRTKKEYESFSSLVSKDLQKLIASSHTSSLCCFAILNEYKEWKHEMTDILNEIGAVMKMNTERLPDCRFTNTILSELRWIQTGNLGFQLYQFSKWIAKIQLCLPYFDPNMPIEELILELISKTQCSDTFMLFIWYERLHLIITDGSFDTCFRNFDVIEVTFNLIMKKLSVSYSYLAKSIASSCLKIPNIT